jgi:uncharacterized protein YbaR (Trm112 family)
VTNDATEAARLFMESQACPECRQKNLRFLKVSNHFEIPRAAYIEAICPNCRGEGDRLIVAWVLWSHLMKEGDADDLPTDATPATGV